MFTKRYPSQEAEKEGRGPKDFVTAETSPLVYARVAGFLLLFVAIIAPFSQLYVPSILIVPGDAAATANNIGASGWVLHLGIVSDSLVFLIEIVLCVLLYVLLRPVSRTLSLVAAFARLAMPVVMGVNLLQAPLSGDERGDRAGGRRRAATDPVNPAATNVGAQLTAVPKGTVISEHQ
jgi:hypothetical protein